MLRAFSLPRKHANFRLSSPVPSDMRNAAKFRASSVGRGLAPAAISRIDHNCAARPEAGLAHGNL